MTGTGLQLRIPVDESRNRTTQGLRKFRSRPVTFGWAAALGLLVASPAVAVVVYSGPSQNVTYSFSTPPAFSLFGETGTWDDIRLDISVFEDLDSVDYRFLNLVQAHGNYVEFATSTLFEIKKFSAGASIGAGETWSGNTYKDFSNYAETLDPCCNVYVDRGEFRNATGYAGIRMADGADVYYGWIQVAVTNYDNSSLQGVLVDWAYENVAGQPILAGATSGGVIPAYYLRSTVGAPWGQSTNEAAMDAAFGAGNWVDERYETVDTTALFATPGFIFMEGSDNNADELEAFIGANLLQIRNFMALGGVVFFNAAPNEGNGMGYPDAAGGQSIALTYPDFSVNPIGTSVAGHAIFNGPLPTTTSFTGNNFAHGSLTGAGLTSLLDDSIARSVLAEMAIGHGLALYGGMTTTNYHSPQPDADNLRANILAYGESMVYLPEPSTASGLLAGILAVAVCGRRRRRRRSA